MAYPYSHRFCSLGLVALALCCLAEFGPATRCAAQATGSKPKSATAKSAANAKAPAAVGAKSGPAAAPDSAEREQILHSAQWQQTLQDFEGWLSTQKLYDAQQVKQIKARLEVGISRMTPAQLQWFEGDMQAKLRVLSSDQARDAESYLAQTLAVASPTYARKIRQKLPDVLTATAAQISQQLAAYAAKRDASSQMQAAFNDVRQQQIAHNEQQNQARQQTLQRDADSLASGTAASVTKGNNFTAARDYFPNAGNDGPFGPGTSVGFWGGGFF